MARMLIVDDDAQIRTVLRSMLEREGYDVIEAADGREGLTRYQATPIDVILLDLLMPEQEGMETITMLRRLDPMVKIIARSGGGQTGRMDFLELAAVLGAQRTLRKPFSRQTLLDAVRALMPDDA
jgi:two-component system chemotaxis response regulator CheY